MCVRVRACVCVCVYVQVRDVGVCEVRRYLGAIAQRHRWVGGVTQTLTSTLITLTLPLTLTLNVTLTLTLTLAVLMNLDLGDAPGGVNNDNAHNILLKQIGPRSPIP